MDETTERMNRARRLAQDKLDELTASPVERGVMGDDNPHPQTIFVRKKCPSCGKFYRTDIEAETCADCIEEDYSRFDCAN